MLWRGVSLLAFTLWAGSVFSQGSGPLSELDLLIQQALESNREILAAQQRVAEARSLLRQAGVRPVPTVEVNTASGKPFGTQGEEEYTVGYFHPIETGGKRPKRVLVAEKGLELAEAELAERSRQLVYDIKSRYIEAVANKRKVEAMDRIAAVNRDSYRLVEARVESGDAAPLERQLLFVELNRTQAERVSAAGQAEASEVDLWKAAAVGSRDPVMLPVSHRLNPVSTSIDELQRRALDKSPDLRAARALEAESKAELQLVEAQGRPDLTLSAQYARRYAQFEDPIRMTASGSPLLLQDRDNILTVGVSIPIQTRKRNLGNIEAAAARESAARLRRQHLERTIPLEVEAAWKRYQSAEKVVHVLSRGVLDEAERNLKIIRQAYNLGQLRLLDVLNEQGRLLETELSYVNAETELARSRAELERAVGGDVK